ncbi:MAG TPA: GNAT family N-acetyltransferase, partial [Polyangiaceae bacterium]|nr:GNAT family N-acetyltransferase [Polyangiaceae bacterium]
MDTAQANVSELVFEAAEARHAAALVDLFARTNTPCHCQYWHFTGDKNAWLDRIFHAPEENRAAFVSGLERAELKGVLALAGEQAVGWMKLCAAEQVPKLYEQRLYKGLPCFNGPRDGVLTIGCMLVDEDFRRRGVARSLIRSGIALAEKSGARAIEAFPRRSEHARAPELWLGPASAFLEAGFQ